MALSPKIIRTQMARLKPLLKSRSLKTMRRGQELIGELMCAAKSDRFVEKRQDFEKFSGTWIVPKDERREGAILYLHGGGYTCGGVEYAKAFGVTLAENFGVKVFCVGYRLAPEHPFPAALEDALEAYQYLMHCGYGSEHIMLCGESTGGGLCYGLCLKLKEYAISQPSGIIAISPWTDLTLSGVSYEENRESDPSLTMDFLRFCAISYTSEPNDPLVSAIFGDLSSLPPSLIFAAENEMLRSDAQTLHESLQRCGCISTLKIKPDRWHAYIVYGVGEDRDDMEEIGGFLNRYLCRERKLRWLRLDNAAKIFPSTRNQRWSNVYRISFSMRDDIDVAVMQSALDVTVRRFPSIAARIRRGTFWYYLQQLEQAPTIREEVSYPLARMSRSEARRCALRVIVYQNRIAVEFFHSLTDGSGGMIFLKTLIAEYLEQKYAAQIPFSQGVLDRVQQPSKEELEDSFQKYAGPVKGKRREKDAWRLSGTPEYDGFVNLTCFELSAQCVREKAKTYGVSVTTYLCAMLMYALQNMQKEQVPNVSRRKPIKVHIPVNLRNLFPSQSVRNFFLFTTPQLETRLGEYTFEEICSLVNHWMGLDITPRKMAMMVAGNVSSERVLLVRLMPLFIKTLILKLVYFATGERKSCVSLSNMGNVPVPDEMKPYISYMDFIIGVKATSPYNCGVITYGDRLRWNVVRSTREPQLENALYQVMREQGLIPEISSNS